DPLPRLDLRHRDGNLPVARDLDERAERLLAFGDVKLTAPMARPQCDGDDETDARTAADQEASAVDLQCANWAFNARRSILPVPRRGNGSSEKMNRSGILNLAMRPSRNRLSSA